METQIIQSITAAIFVSAAASLLGSFVILKKMALVGDALSHVALPGMALGLLFHFNPFLGGFITLFIAILGVWFLKYQTKLPIDTLVGIFFTTSLAIGVLIIPEHDLLEAMFGDIALLGFNEAVFSIIISIAIIAAILAIRKNLVVNMLSEELSHSIGINNKKTEFVYLLIFAVAVALGIKFVGALLMGSLVIIPAASAKNIAKNLKGFMGLSVIFGVISTIFGIYLSYFLKIPPGPLFIIAATTIFIATLAYRKIKLS